MAAIYIGSDHAGFSLKEQIKAYLKANASDVKVTDLTPVTTPDDDYPDVAAKVAQSIIASNSRGILICGSGIGVSMAANKVHGIRAAVCRTRADIVGARNDEDANVLCLGGKVTSAEEAIDIVEGFLETPFAGASPGGARHKRRVLKLKGLEK